MGTGENGTWDSKSCGDETDDKYTDVSDELRSNRLLLIIESFFVPSYNVSRKSNPFHENTVLFPFRL